MIKSLTILGRECPVVPMSPVFPDVLVCGYRYGIIQISLIIVTEGEKARVEATVGIRGDKGESITVTEKPGLRIAIDWAETRAKILLTEISQQMSEFVWEDMAVSILERISGEMLEKAAKQNGEASWC